METHVHVSYKHTHLIRAGIYKP